LGILKAGGREGEMDDQESAGMGGGLEGDTLVNGYNVLGGEGGEAKDE
jgi:hypothetical protein